MCSRRKSADGVKSEVDVEKMTPSVPNVKDAKGVGATGDVSMHDCRDAEPRMLCEQSLTPQRIAYSS